MATEKTATRRAGEHLRRKKMRGEPFARRRPPCFTEILFEPGLPHRGGHSTIPLPLRAWEELMAKGQMRSSKEKKKPKADKDKPKQVSAYKQAQTGGGSAALSAPKKA